MGVTAFASGTQLASGAEDFLANVNVAGTFTLHLDLVNMVDGDIVEVRIYQMVLTAGTPRVAYFTAFYGAQPTHDVIKISVPLGNELTDAQALRFSLTQTFGVAKNFPWKVLQYG